MFDKNSDYVRNKYRRNSIVYRSVTGTTYELKQHMFLSEVEFRIWKEWSDLEYYYAERDWRKNRSQVISLHLLIGNINTSPSAEEEYFTQILEVERRHRQAKMICEIRKKLTKKQYRRLWFFFVERQT